MSTTLNKSYLCPRAMQLSFENDFLFRNEEKFFNTVFFNTRYTESCRGLVSAHSDKCEQYREYWDRYKIPFYHAILVYLLTYTKVFEETPKHLSREWVVVNYHKYQDLLESFR